MTTATAIRPFLTLLTERSQDILEQTATSFWTSRKDHSARLTSLKKGNPPYETTLKLIFETAIEQQAFVSACLNANISPSCLVYCTGVKPSIGEHAASIELELLKSQDVANLKMYCKALLPEEWVLEKIEGKKAVLRHTTKSDPAGQKAQLVKEMPTILAKFTLSYPLPNLLFRNKNSEFPGENISFPTEETLENVLGTRCRNFLLGPDLQEEMPLPQLDASDCIAPATPQELEDWLIEPAAQKDKIIQKCKDVFERIVKAAYSAKPRDEEKIAVITTAAEIEPLLDEVLTATTME